MGRYGGGFSNIGPTLIAFAGSYFELHGRPERDTPIMRAFMERLEECGSVLMSLEDHDVGPSEGAYLDNEEDLLAVLRAHPAQRKHAAEARVAKAKRIAESAIRSRQWKRREKRTHAILSRGAAWAKKHPKEVKRLAKAAKKREQLKTKSALDQFDAAWDSMESKATKG
jgi:hypothetical protein